MPLAIVNVETSRLSASGSLARVDRYGARIQTRVQRRLARVRELTSWGISADGCTASAPERETTTDSGRAADRVETSSFLSHINLCLTGCHRHTLSPPREGEARRGTVSEVGPGNKSGRGNGDKPRNGRDSNPRAKTRRGSQGPTSSQANGRTRRRKGKACPRGVGETLV